MQSLTECPDSIKAVDLNAEILWPIFLKKTGIAMSTDKKTVIDNEGRRALMIRSFGIPSLAARLSDAKDEISRARIWWRESIACSEGVSDIPDLKTDNRHILNPFIVTPSLRFKDPRIEAMHRVKQVEPEWGVVATPASPKRGRPVKSQQDKRVANAARQRRFRSRAA